MATIDSTLCTTAEEVTHRTTWVIKNFDYLMQESGFKCLEHPTLEIQINSSEKTSSNWNLVCSPNSVRKMNLIVDLGWHHRNSVGKIGHLITLKSKLKIVRSIFLWIFPPEKFV
jgi:hypothetical protein